MFSPQLITLVALSVLATANPLERRTATNVFPTPPTTSHLSKPITVAAGQTFTPSQAYSPLRSWLGRL
ncbi:hypothetical protein MPER_11516 [Moniliophthora perniciosa FA553]|nr:hypothetical protein MPER_11516 [Moniliophthora perniciosa FA553]